MQLTTPFPELASSLSLLREQLELFPKIISSNVTVPSKIIEKEMKQLSSTLASIAHSSIVDMNQNTKTAMLSAIDALNSLTAQMSQTFLALSKSQRQIIFQDLLDPEFIAALKNYRDVLNQQEESPVRQPLHSVYTDIECTVTVVPPNLFDIITTKVSNFSIETTEFLKVQTSKINDRILDRYTGIATISAALSLAPEAKEFHKVSVFILGYVLLLLLFRDKK